MSEIKNTFFDREPAAITTIVSRKDNLSYEILLTSYVEDNKEKHQEILFNFFNACHMTKSDNNKIGTFAKENIMNIYSGKEPCAILTVSDKGNHPIYKMFLVSHAKSSDAIYKHQERFSMAASIVERYTDSIK